MQGDVISILDSYGATVVSYVYDSWGKVISIKDPQGNDITDAGHIAYKNPIRYRGYYYDTETNLYYLNSRYYDPEIGRWISSNLNTRNAYIDPVNQYLRTIQNNINTIASTFNIGGIAASYSSKGGIFADGLGGSVLSLSASSGSIKWLNLDIVGEGFGWFENGFSAIAGAIDGYRQIKGLNKIPVLNKASNWLMGIGITLNVGLSIYDNLTASGLTDKQRAGNISGDVVYIGLNSAASWGVGALVAMIPVVGPFIAVPAAMGTGYVMDQLWYGEWLTIDGNSIDEHIKNFFEWVFGG